MQLVVSEKLEFGENFTLFLGTKNIKFEFGAVLIVWDRWYNAESWSLMFKAMLSRCPLARRR